MGQLAQYIPRRVSEVPDVSSDWAHSGAPDITAVDYYRDRPAWILIGEPGSGKSTTFEHEARIVGGMFCSVAEFLYRDIDLINGQTLFIDGLDEFRGEGGTGSSITYQIAARLESFGVEKFRLSCRAADWYGSSDLRVFARIFSESTLPVLQLEPLSQEEIKQLLTAWDIPDVEWFLEYAKQHDLYELLKNPHTLGLAVDLREDSMLPSSKLELFEKASAQMTVERDKRKRDQQRSNHVSPTTIVEVAGYICSLLLLGGREGVASDKDGDNKSYTFLEGIEYKYQRELPRAMGSSLFVPGESQEQLKPAHRSIAEYLAAKWLSGQLQAGYLPEGRLLNLFLGLDGKVITGLRGLYAWLATVGEPVRKRLMHRDPNTVLLYGDCSIFTTDEKQSIYDGILLEIDRSHGFDMERSGQQMYRRLSDVGLIELYRDVLHTGQRDEKTLRKMCFALDVVSENTAFKSMLEDFYEVLTDDTLPADVRVRALENWIYNADDGFSRRQLLLAVASGEIADPDDELLGALLERLYPCTVGPEEIFQYLHRPKASSYYGRYRNFWACTLCQRSKSTDFPVLMDALASRECYCSDDYVAYQRIVPQLLAVTLDNHGENSDGETLFRWLGVGANAGGHTQGDRNAEITVATWLEKNPRKHLEILETCFQKARHEENISMAFLENQYRLRQAPPPPSLGRWHLERAEQEEREVARVHIGEALRTMGQDIGDQGLSVDLLFEWAGDDEANQEWLKENLVCKYPPCGQEHQDFMESFRAEAEKEKAEQTQVLYGKLGDISNAEVAPALLYTLADVWRGTGSQDIDEETPLQRFHSFVTEDFAEPLLRAAEAGFMTIVQHAPLPSAHEIIANAINHQEPYVRLPALIGMGLLWARDKAEVEKLAPERLHSIIAFWLTDFRDDTPLWFDHLLEHQIDTVADLYCEYVVKLLKAREHSIRGIYNLREAQYSTLARVCVSRLIAGFPARTRKEHLPYLKVFLRLALDFHPEELNRIVHEKLQTQTDVGQHVYYLVSNMLLKHPQAERELWDYVGGNAKRLDHVVEFLTDHRSIRLGLSVSVNTIGKLIELLTPQAEMDRFGTSGIVTAAMMRGDIVPGLIHQLGEFPPEESASEFDRLLEIAALKPIHLILERRRYEQRLRERDRRYSYLSPTEVARIITNGEPVTTADLAALVCDHINDIDNGLRSSNDDSVRLFWEQSLTDEPEPKVENLCRDVVLGKLREKTYHTTIVFEPEGDMHLDRRCDIKAYFRNQLQLPIEIKCEWNDALWRGISQQLIGRYTQCSEGFGIYLVLWFGEYATSKKRRQPAAADGGSPPHSASELETRLRAYVPPDHEHSIFVKVIDLSFSGIYE